MTKPPPYDSAPTLNATHTSERTPPVLAVAAASSRSGVACISKTVGLPEMAYPEFDCSAAQQRDHQPRTNRRRCDTACERVDHPSAVDPSPPPACREQADPRVHSNHRDGGTRARARTEYQRTG